ncbi:MAG: hypothetical protein NVS9B4_24420 [Candidatus Acidiferrum sp.]
MRETLHERAECLIAQQRVEGISVIEKEWLDGHLAACARCATVAQGTANALRTLRGLTVETPRGMVERTQFRVRLRAQELREREPKRRALWLACGFSWAFGLLSAPYVWRAFAWLGERTGLPKYMWELSFVLWWMIPAAAAAVILLMENARRGGELGWTQLEE